MKELRFNQEDRELWLSHRLGKITGSRLAGLYSKRNPENKKIGFWELAVEKLALPPDGEDPMERGSRLESEALDRFEKETGKKVKRELVLWARDEDENIAVSPDGAVSKIEAVEVKCLSSARHLEAYWTKKIPEDYELQAIQYFVVNDKLKKLNFAFYDPRFSVVPSKTPIDFFVIEVTRQEVSDRVEEFLEYERKVINEVNAIVNQLTF